MLGKTSYRERITRRRRPTGQKGYILVTTALLLTGLIAATGLSVDIGRMYIARNEAQTFADAAALAGGLELDGSAQGVTNARNAALAVAKKYDLHTRTFAGTEVYFATDAAGPWNLDPSSPINVRFVRVIARTSIPVYLIPLSGAGSTGGSGVVAVAGQAVETSFGSGLFPLSPFAADQNDHAYGGLVPGQIYTLRWGANNIKFDQVYDSPAFNGGSCPGDFNMPGQTTINMAKVEPLSRRGYYAPFASSSDQRGAILNDDSGGVILEVGDSINNGPGNHNSNGNAIQDRIAQDTDPNSTTFAAYQSNRVNGVRVGNGRRIVGAPVNSGMNGNTPYEIVAIGSFFLLHGGWYNANGNEPYCAEFIGPWVQGSKNPGAGPGGSYALRLVE